MPTSADLRRAVPPAARDAAVAAVLLGGSFVPGLAHNGVVLGDLAPRAWNAGAIVLIVAQSVPVALSRRFHLAALVVVAVAFGVFQAVGYEPAFASLGLFVAVYAAARETAAPRVVAAAATVAYLGLVVALAALHAPVRPVDYVTFFLVPVGAWLLGRWTRSRVAAEAVREQLAAEQAVAAERRRLAGELHDVVSHHVTAMVVQAGAAELLAGDADPRVPAALEAIADTGRSALADLRELLAVLGSERPEGDRRPTLSAVASLVDTSARAGHPVVLHAAEGVTAAVPDAVQLAAYRVVQEGLTNAMKHAPDQPTVVRLDRTPSALRIEVANRLPDRPSPALVGGSGRGLTGLRERIALLGGTFAAAPDGARGQFVVCAELPLQDGRP